ncbi:MAG: hypothetical protein GY913_05785 [Proteobacteria bacterium]|nr:hypothetical protein [Pseudomonadota bacterium]MCP4916415.1 hypothetical protein [Pseudomonadota bacterium]
MAAFVALALLGVAQAGWTQPDGGHYAKLGVRGIVGDQVFPSYPITPMQGGTDGVVIGDYQDWALQAYVEYGLTGDWTLVAQGTPIGFSMLEDESTVYTGVLKAGINCRLLSGRHNISAQLDVGYTPPVGEVDLMAAHPTLDVMDVYAFPYQFIPTQSGAEAVGTLGYGTGFGRNWFSGSVGAGWYQNADIDPAVVGFGQLGRTTKRDNRWDLILPFRVPLGGSMHSNVTGVGNSSYVGLNVNYTFTWGDGWGVSTGVYSVVRASSNLEAPTLPLFFEHSGTPE